MVYRSKLDWIGKFVCSETGDGKTVLDLGCVCHDLDQTAVPNSASSNPTGDVPLSTYAPTECCN